MLRGWVVAHYTREHVCHNKSGIAHRGRTGGCHRDGLTWAFQQGRALRPLWGSVFLLISVFVL
jgi:hypothetical protein